MEYNPLRPAGIIDVSRQELVSVFVEPFEHKERRGYLVGRFEALIERFEETGVSAEVWIDGSFATIKPEPADVDMVMFYDENQVKLLENDKQVILRELGNSQYTKIRYNCDLYFAPNNRTDVRSYWRGWFGFTREEQPKGIFRMFV